MHIFLHLNRDRVGVETVIKRIAQIAHAGSSASCWSCWRTVQLLFQPVVFPPCSNSRSVFGSCFLGFFDRNHVFYPHHDAGDDAAEQETAGNPSAKMSFFAVVCLLLFALSKLALDVDIF